MSFDQTVVRRVAIVEDHGALRIFLRDVLTRLGWKVTGVAGHRRGRRRARARDRARRRRRRSAPRVRGRRRRADPPPRRVLLGHEARRLHRDDGPDRAARASSRRAPTGSSSRRAACPSCSRASTRSLGGGQLPEPEPRLRLGPSRDGRVGGLAGVGVAVGVAVARRCRGRARRGRRQRVGLRRVRHADPRRDVALRRSGTRPTPPRRRPCRTAPGRSCARSAGRCRPRSRSGCAACAAASLRTAACG